MTGGFERVAPKGGALGIQGYTPGGGFRAGGRTFAQGLLILPEAVHDWPVTTLEAVTLDQFAPLLGAEPALEILLIGTGSAMRRPDRVLLDALKAQGLAVDFMDSRAAARTYNVLVTEARRVAAALLPVL